MSNVPEKFAEMCAYAHRERNLAIRPPGSISGAQVWDRAFREVCLMGQNTWAKTNPFPDSTAYPLQTIARLHNYLQGPASTALVAQCAGPLAEMQDKAPVSAYIEAITNKRMRLCDLSIHTDAMFVNCTLVVGLRLVEWHISGTAEDKVRCLELDDFVLPLMADDVRQRFKRFDEAGAGLDNFCETAINPKRSDRGYLQRLIKHVLILAKHTFKPIEQKASAAEQKMGDAADIAQYLGSRYERPAIDDICALWNIKCPRSATKAALVRAIADMHGDRAMDDNFLCKHQ